jgi:hypothetical protein
MEKKECTNSRLLTALLHSYEYLGIFVIYYAEKTYEDKYNEVWTILDFGWTFCSSNIKLSWIWLIFTFLFSLWRVLFHHYICTIESKSKIFPILLLHRSHVTVEWTWLPMTSWFKLNILFSFDCAFQWEKDIYLQVALRLAFQNTIKPQGTIFNVFCLKFFS